MTKYHVTCPFSGEKYTFNTQNAIRKFIASMMAQREDCNRTIRIYSDAGMVGSMRKTPKGIMYRLVNSASTYPVNKDGSLGKATRTTKRKNNDQSMMVDLDRSMLKGIETGAVARTALPFLRML